MFPRVSIRLRWPPCGDAGMLDRAAPRGSNRPRRSVTRTTRVVTTDDYVTTTPVRTRTRYYSARIPRNEIVEYGSSTYTVPRTQYSAVYQPSYAMRCGPGNSANWGYNYYYGSSSPPWCQARDRKSVV